MRERGGEITSGTLKMMGEELLGVREGFGWKRDPNPPSTKGSKTERPSALDPTGQHQNLLIKCDL